MGAQDGFLKARHPSKSRALEVPIRPQGEDIKLEAIRSMDKDGEEREVMKRRRVAGSVPGSSGACASEEMERLREEMESEDALRPEEAT